MIPTKQIMFTVACLLCNSVAAQSRIEATSENWTSYNCQAIFDDSIIHLTNIANQTALLWLNSRDFKNGIVELDIKGKDLIGESFVGIAFHGADNMHYDAVYFRPFHFKNPEKKDRSLQYVDIPDNDWFVLREKHPGKYERSVNPVPDPNDWFHVKIIVESSGITIFVNHSETPSLVADKLNKRTRGKIGLWIDGQEGWFKNMILTDFK
jgi:hypothetical protein